MSQTVRTTSCQADVPLATIGHRRWCADRHTESYASRLLFLRAVLMKLRAACRYMTAPEFLEQKNFTGWVLLSLLLALWPKPAAVAQSRPQPKRVSILYSFESEVGLLAGFDEPLRTTLRSVGIGPIESHTEFPGLVRFPSALPEGHLSRASAVLFIQASFWEFYKWRIADAVFLIFVQAVLIALLLVQRRRRRQAEEVVRKSEAKYRRLYEGMIDAFIQVDMRGRITEFNEAYHQLVGYEPDELLKFSNDDLTPEKWHALEAEIIERQVLARGYSDVYEKEYRRKDGTIVSVELRTHLIRDESNRACGMWAIVHDITERKKVQKSLQEYENVVESSPNMIAVIDREYRYLIANPVYLQHVGKVRGQVIGHSVADVLGGEFFRKVVKVKLDKCFEGEVVRYETKHGSAELGERDPFASYIPIQGALGVDGAACVVQDITELKQAETALREIGLRILMAQEEERRRVARELHDDFSQRLALLAIDLEELAQEMPATKQDWTGRLKSMWAHTQELTTDIHRLSRQLHPSKLEDLGLVMAVRSYCREISQQTKLKIDFVHRDVPQALPPAISLCLYRIVQETLRNVVKHSGSKDAVVGLSGGPDDIQLSITDSGAGFDVDAFNGNEGIGLVSMRERARYVGGELSIQRRPSGGTRVEARIPLAARSGQRALAGVEVSSGARDVWPGWV
jgi:PAS domain S-box-containing protein